MTWDEYRVTFRSDNNARLLWWDTDSLDEALDALKRAMAGDNLPDLRIEHRVVTTTPWEVVE